MPTTTKEGRDVSLRMSESKTIGDGEENTRRGG